MYPSLFIVKTFYNGNWHILQEVVTSPHQGQGHPEGDVQPESPWKRQSGEVAVTIPSAHSTRVLSPQKQRALGLPEGIDLRNTDV